MTRASHPQPNTSGDRRACIHAWLTALAMVLIVAAGAFFRLYQLGEPALRADTLLFYRFCSLPISATELWSQWPTMMHGSGQFPLVAFITKLFIDVLYLKTTFLTVRIPSAVFGILAIPAAYQCGKLLAGRGTGVIMALLLALNPYHIQVSREAYFYSCTVLGAFVAFWCCMRIIALVREGAALPLSVILLNTAGFVLMAYSQPTGLTASVVVAATIACVLLSRIMRTRTMGRDIILLLLCYVLAALPLILSAWGLRELITVSTSSKETWLKHMAVSEGTAGGMVFRVLTGFAWGSTPLRAGFLIVTALIGLAVFVKGVRRKGEYIVIPAFLIGIPVMYALGRISSAAAFEPRYVACMIPAYLAFLSLGIGVCLPRISDGMRARISILLTLCAMALCIRPAWLVTRMTGNPTPYRDIVSWVDSNLPRNTLVLVDRYLEAGNEFVVHPSTNVWFAYTRPNEPLSEFIKCDWRKTARDFFARYPDSAYLEVAKEYWHVPEVGPWDWPRKFFARHVSFTNSAGLELRELGLAARGEFYAANTNRLIVDLFYNLPEDVLGEMKEVGANVVVLYNNNWFYDKIESDFSDWRVMTDKAGFDIYNLTDADIDVALRITGMSMGGSKLIQVPGHDKHRFQDRVLSEWTIGPIRTKPGRNTIRIVDWMADKTGAVLLVSEIKLLPDAAGR